MLALFHLIYLNQRDQCVFNFLIICKFREKNLQLRHEYISYYYRWGQNIGSLQVSTLQNTPTGPKQTLVWERNETQAKEWRLGQIFLSDIPYSFAMKIDGYIGSGYEGDVC